MILRELINKYNFEVDEQALKNAEKTVDKFSKKLVKVGKDASKLGKSLTARLTLPIVGIGVGLVKTASDFEEANSKFNTVFSSIEERAQKTGQSLARDFGLSRKEAIGLLGDTGDLLTGFGFTQDSALNLSNQVQELAVDLASFTNFSGGAKGASQALTKALLGERESIKSLGISIQEEDVKKKVAELRAQGLTFQTERQAKAVATLKLAYAQSKNAIGDFARTQDGLANQTRLLMRDVSDLSVELGQILIPIANDLVGMVREGIAWFKGLSKETKTLILIIGAAAAAAGPLLIVFGAMASGAGQAIMLITKMAGAFKFLGNAAALAQTKLFLIPLALAAIGAAIFLIAEDFNSFSEGRDSVIGRLFIGLDNAFSMLGEKFKNLGAISRSIVAIILTPFRALINSVKIASGAIDALRGKKSLKDFASESLDRIKSTFNIAKASDSLGGALGLEGGSPVAGLAAQARQSQAAQGTTVNQSAELKVDVTGLPPETAKEVAQQSITDALGGMLRETARSARPAIER